MRKLKSIQKFETENQKENLNLKVMSNIRGGIVGETSTTEVSSTADFNGNGDTDCLDVIEDDKGNKISVFQD